MHIVYVLPRHDRKRRIALQDGLKVGLSGLIMWEPVVPPYRNHLGIVEYGELE